METKRVFIAIKVQLSNELNTAWQELKEQLQEERIRWVSVDNLHLTLRFLGNLTLPEIEQVKLALKKVCASRQRFSFYLKGISFFGHRGVPAVIFFKITESEELKKLAEELRMELDHVGVASNKKFTPHLTIGRLKKLKQPDQFHQSIEKFSLAPEQEVEVSEVIFFESILKESGAEYRKIMSCEL